MGRVADAGKALHKVVELHAHPRRGAEARGVVVQPYRGYGSADEVFLMGRVFRQSSSRGRGRPGVLRRDLANILALILRQGVGGALLVARFALAEQQVITDANGYFQVHLRLTQRPAADCLWHSLDLELRWPLPVFRTRGTFFVPCRTARYVVISDIDDTVMETGVARKLRAFWRLFLEGAQSRVAFPGVAALYRALHQGLSGTARNPLLYVSQAPWSLYEMFDEFFHLHDIPVGPILFLREWGLAPGRPLPRRVEDHKLSLIRTMLSLYGELPFVLIGDSGQRDPEIYTQIVREHPGRVLAVYIRNVSRNPARLPAIEALARQVAQAGASLVLAADSFVMARHAAEHHLISADALTEVLQERAEQQGRTAPTPTHEVKRPTPRATQEAVERGEVKEKLSQPTPTSTPPSVVVTSEQDHASKDQEPIP